MAVKLVRRKRSGKSDQEHGSPIPGADSRKDSLALSSELRAQQ
jgi:hypothetical protein